VDLKDATLMIWAESADHPAVAAIARSAYEQLVQGDGVDHRLLDDLIGEASGKGVLRAIGRKYSPAAFESVIMPICREIGRQAPIRSDWRSSMPAGSADDPLTAAAWPPR
jgi:hypothetical protein